MVRLLPKLIKVKLLHELVIVADDIILYDWDLSL